MDERDLKASIPRSLERTLAAARADYRSIRYRGPALDRARATPSPGLFSLGSSWRPALALATLAAAVGVIWLVARHPEIEPAPVAAAPPLSSPLVTLSSARRVITAIPVPVARPADGFGTGGPRELFRLPAPPPRPSGFGASSDSA